MFCAGKGTVIYDETSSDSNTSMTSLECSDDLNMLYLLASVAEEVSLDRLDALATAANYSADSTSKCKLQTTELPAVTKMPATQINKGGCDERRIFRMKCPFCCRCFSRKENLRWHMKKHVKERVLEDATAPTFSASLLPADQTVAGQVDSRIASAVPDSCGFWCVKCEKNFEREATFRVHMRFHSRRRPVLCLPLRCKKCGDLCTTKTQYLIHKKMHRMEKVFRMQAILPTS